MKRKDKKIIKLVLAMILLSLTSLYKVYEKEINNYLNPIEQKRYQEVSKSVPNLEVTFLDVGQADSTLIRYKDKNILIDAGNNNDGNLLVEYFKSENINTFDYLIASHNHEDHIGGMDEIIDNFNVNHFLATEINKNIEKSLQNKNLKQEIPTIDETFNVDELKLKVLTLDNDKEDINKNSLVIKLTYKNNSFLFTGDTTKEKELEILDKDLKSDVLKVAHHGSKYSSSAQFIKKVQPTYAVISVGKNNRYNHPDQVTLDKFEYIKTKVYQTKDDNSIKFISDGENINVEKIITNTNKE